MEEMNEPWTMPEWMEPYRDLICNTGGNPVEYLMNATSAQTRANSILMGLVVGCHSQVFLLVQLRAKGLLTSPEETKRLYERSICTCDGGIGADGHCPVHGVR